MTAGEALVQRVIVALEGVVPLNGAFEGPPVQASFPYAVVDAGLESDWSHKSGEGREVRLTVTLRDEGEKPARLRRLIEEAHAACSGVGGDADGWRIVSFSFVRSRLMPERDRRWAAVIDYRARMLGA